MEGGRLFDDKTWGAERVHVVRDDVVIPNGVTLTLAAGCVVKFLPGSRLVVEGALVSHGASLADFADDSVAGDTNLDEADSMPSGIDWWLDDPAVSALAAVWGKKNLADPTESWQKVKDGEEGGYNFFKVTVEMP